MDLSPLPRRAALAGLTGTALLAVGACTPTRQHDTALPPQSQPAAPVPSEDPAGFVKRQRDRIDALDNQIIALLRERTEVSRSIQQARVATGGSQTDTGREAVVADRYRAAFGAPGDEVATAVLELAKAQSGVPSPSARPSG
ncbi:chorismate mutase [Goodfellowiella coeruleoviolacea]|uniref:Chorismate mutase n=1 Tax=Goodfellowiella coeruleoviolacea TaxID=334858 RepID=A0AAE3GLF5_9PSEU|nr:chorismate mutase [Goodfellowiella coeruleoviolacea]MCP2169662.1 chorismate mutase [Goodfellowiella coeruleoviolacea]